MSGASAIVTVIALLALQSAPTEATCGKPKCLPQLPLPLPLPLPALPLPLPMSLPCLPAPLPLALPCAPSCCGPPPSPLPVIQAPPITLPACQGPIIPLPSPPIPPPKTIAHKCICTKTVIKPQVIQRCISVPSVQTYLKRSFTPVIENIAYRACPKCTPCAAAAAASCALPPCAC